MLSGPPLFLNALRVVRCTLAMFAGPVASRMLSCAATSVIGRSKAIQQKLDRLDDAFIYKESIDLGTYERQRDRLREELTLVEIDHHGSKVEEFDVEGTLNVSGMYGDLQGLVPALPSIALLELTEAEEPILAAS